MVSYFIKDLLQRKGIPEGPMTGQIFNGIGNGQDPGFPLKGLTRYPKGFVCFARSIYS